MKMGEIGIKPATLRALYEIAQRLHGAARDYIE
jgi:hypothetical protein